MVERSVAEKAEFLSRRRARTLPLLAAIYLAQQGSYFAALQSPSHTSSYTFRISAWLVLSAVLLAALVTKGFWLQPREVRDLIDDEHTKANRLDALRIGFIFAMLAGMAVYFIDQFEPLTAGAAAHLILTFGLGAALIRFGLLERHAHRDG
jgi:hypothetical protein